MLITSRTLSTTQMVLRSRELSEQIEHTSSSEIIQHSRQNLASSRILTIESAKWWTFSDGCLRRCNARRKALRRPTPGREPMACTASSRSFEGNDSGTVIYFPF